MYNKTGKGGPSRLTTVLNSYIGSMVQEIISHYGDVLKFSGDAFLAMWKAGVNNSLQDIIHEALDSAIIIQKSFGTYETDVGIFLRGKNYTTYLHSYRTLLVKLSTLGITKKIYCCSKTSYCCRACDFFAYWRR